MRLAIADEYCVIVGPIEVSLFEFICFGTFGAWRPKLSSAETMEAEVELIHYMLSYYYGGVPVR